MMQKLRVAFGLALLALLLLFIFVNLEQVPINFLIGSAKMPVAFVILISAALGAGMMQAFRVWKSPKPEKK